MYMTGFADEAGDSIETQIKATQELGWENIEARGINGKNIHDLNDREFDKIYGILQDSGIKINCFGSAIANWGKDIRDPFDSSLAEAKRAIDRMQRLGSKLIRVMSFAVIPNASPKEQMKEERFKRLNILKKMFDDAGITMVHENCMNYGGMGYKYTLELIENVPDLKLVFDTGNPVQTLDYDKITTDSSPMQSSIEFFLVVKDFVEYIHIKDGIYDPITQKTNWCFPGEGDGNVKEVLTRLISDGYDGGISIEPHVDVVYHEGSNSMSKEEIRYRNYINYGKQTVKMIKEIKKTTGRL